MPTYICLMNLTNKGIQDIKNAPEQIARAIETLEEMGGKLIALYTTMGAYDYVSIAEFPSDEVAMTYLLGLGAAGLVRTTTLKAFTAEQLGALVENLS